MLKRVFVVVASLCLSPAGFAQQAGQPPQTTAAPPSAVGTNAAPGAAKRQAPHPLADQAPGAGPDKVWVNLASAKYHCPGDRYYGRTNNGRYMTEAAAKSAGAKGPRGKDCPAAKQ